MKADQTEGGVEMDMKKLHQFAEEYHQLFCDSSICERDVIDGFAEKCFELNLEMDCGHAFQETYGVRAFSSPQSLEKIIDVVDDPIILGAGIFSQWRYVVFARVSCPKPAPVDCP